MALGVLVVLAAACSTEPATPPPPRNAVVVCLDTVRHDVFELPESIGWSDPLSGELDEALRLESALAPAPWTVPSVASVLTGRYPATHGAGRFPSTVADLDREVPTAIADGVPTLAEVLSREGLRTGASVAHPWFSAGYGLDRGFDSTRVVKGRKEVLEEGLAWLDGAADATREPFFLYLHFMEAHEYHRGPLDDVRERASRLPSPLAVASEALAPADTCSEPDSEACVRWKAYVVAVLELRGSVAELLGQLERRGLGDRTMVVVFADHGEEFGDHRGEERALAVDPRGLAGVGHGHALYQELLHVPLVVWRAGVSGRSDVPVSLVDIWPTILRRLEGEGGAESAPGRPIDLLLRRADSVVDRPLFASGIAFGPEQTAVVLGDRKRIGREDWGRSLTFDLDSDPEERSPLSASAPELDALLERYEAARSGAAGDGSVPEIDAAMAEELRSLGYLGGGDNR
ncbi:MAG: sulfatase [Thermoanaerobaculia bacterium]